MYLRLSLDLVSGIRPIKYILYFLTILIWDWWAGDRLFTKGFMNLVMGGCRFVSTHEPLGSSSWTSSPFCTTSFSFMLVWTEA